MEKILQRISTLNNYELEVRIHLDPDSWRALLLLILNSIPDSKISKVEQSITVLLESGDHTDRSELFYEQGVKKSEVHIRKTSLEHHKNILYNRSYTISVATETSIPKPNLSLANKIRVRLRLSLVLDKFPHWRVDFTFVKTIFKTQFQTELKAVREDIFKVGKKITSENFLEYLSTLKYGSSDPQVSYEFELEYVGKNKPQENDIKDAIHAVIVMLDPEIEKSSKYHKSIYPIALSLLKDQGADYAEIYKHTYTLKQLVNQPKNFSVEEYYKHILPNINNYYLSDKADGERCMIHFDGARAHIIGSDTVTDVTEQLVKADLKSIGGETILDAEVLGFAPGSAKTFGKVYLFDVMMFGGQKTTNMPFEERQHKLEDIANLFGTTFEKKIQVRLDEHYATAIREVYERSSRLYPIDGLIFTPAQVLDKVNVKYRHAENYFDMVVYKWKPVEKLTIDFLVMKPPANLLGIAPYIVKDGYDMYFLFSGIMAKLMELLNLERVKGYHEIFNGYKFRQDYFPIQFSPSSNPHAYIYYHPQDNPIKDEQLHGHTVEFGYRCFAKDDNNNDNKMCWYIQKLRPDKDINIARGTEYGNNFKVADATYQTYQNPVTLETLTSDRQSESYFKNPKTQMYKALTKYNGFVKAQILRQLENADWIIDPTAGKGQDLFIYNGFGIKNGLFMDIDKDAIEELNVRKYSLDKPEFYVHSEKPKSRISIYTKIADLTEPHEKLISELQDVPLPPKGVDGIVLNFSLHYVVSSAETLDNLISFVSLLLKPGGLLIFTCFDGEKIFKILKTVDYEKAWELREGEVVKYSIIKQYQGDQFADFGQKISVLHPFSNGEHYQENLINLAAVIKAFTDKKYEVRQHNSFGEWMGKYRIFDRKHFDMLTKEDVLYSSLYSYVTLWKPVELKEKEGRKNKKGKQKAEDEPAEE